MRETWTLLALMMALGGCRSLRPPNYVESRYMGPIQSRNVERGEEIFLTICTVCHAGRVNPRGYHWQPGQMRRQIREGNRFMPPIPVNRISEQDLEAVLAFLSTIEAIDGELPPLPSIPDTLVEVTPEVLVPQPPADIAPTEEPEEESPALEPGEERTPEVEVDDASGEEVEDGSATPATEPALNHEPPVGEQPPDTDEPVETEEPPAPGRSLDPP